MIEFLGIGWGITAILLVISILINVIFVISKRNSAIIESASRVITKQKVKEQIEQKYKDREVELEKEIISAKSAADFIDIISM